MIQLHTVAETARILACKRWFVYDAIKRRELAHVRFGRTIRIRETDIADFVARRRAPVVANRDVSCNY